MHKDAVHAGQAIYTPLALKLYDQAVLGLSCRWVWKCPANVLLSHYQQHVSANHLDVGVGTGYFLDKVTFPSPSPRVALMDMNAHSLSSCAKRIARYQPLVYQCNVLEPVQLSTQRFDSLAMNLLLHCLPGSMSDKAAALDNVLPLLAPGAVVFGATLLHDGVNRSPTARGLMSLYNAKGIFNNRDDNDVALSEALNSRLDDVKVKIEGCAALFSGRAPGGRESDCE
ncbi:class I SAM-dependent methyltransferase [Alcanivorax sp.]|uniref:class I SAM-dependent methyltransferase n=1 Tax=Alcanivorax sp. TaxID=1872427 RepID=UPI000C59B4F7|nr:class I SAM-dependent methyltransferase [Alcanivorax sp.]MBQ26437.1 methyltransferase type 12 [Alcanivorax sp.]